MALEMVSIFGIWGIYGNQIKIGFNQLIFQPLSSGSSFLNPKTGHIVDCNVDDVGSLSHFNICGPVLQIIEFAVTGCLQLAI